MCTTLQAKPFLDQAAPDTYEKDTQKGEGIQ